MMKQPDCMQHRVTIVRAQTPDSVLNIVINCIKNLEHEIIVKEPQNVPSENNLRAVLDRSEIQLRSLPKNMLGKKVGTNGI